MKHNLYTQKKLRNGLIWYKQQSKESTTKVSAYASRTKRSTNIFAALSAKCMSVLCKAFWNSVFDVRALRTSHTTVFGRTRSYENYCRPLQERSIEKSVRLATVLEIIRSRSDLLEKRVQKLFWRVVTTWSDQHDPSKNSFPCLFGTRHPANRSHFRFKHHNLSSCKADRQQQ
mgnify:CR=1 FL=1